MEAAGGGEPFRLWVTPDRRELLIPGTQLHGAVHRWGVDWRVNGVMLIRVAPSLASRLGLVHPSDLDGLFEEYLRRAASHIDDRVLRKASPLTAILAGYPAEWIDRMCESLVLPNFEKKRDKIRRIRDCLTTRPPSALLDGIPPEGLEALRWLLAQGGVVTRGAVLRRVPNDDGGFWRPSATIGPLGALRSRGLVHFGRVAEPGGRMVRSAVVPFELRSRLSGALAAPQGGKANPLATN